MTIPIYRASELYNQPAKRGRPAKRGKFNCGRSHFYEVIEPQLEKVKLGAKATAYTARSCDKVIEDGITEATAERERRAELADAAANSDTAQDR
jgi:hypothetical protein